MVQQNPSLHPTVKKLFEGRKVVVASMHGKHLVMKPLIKQYLNIDTVIVPEFDTDHFGTFSGEIERPFDPITTLRKKILAGLKAAGETLGIGNEGSFGAHPQLPFLHADQEIVMLIDLENDIEIMESVISTDTNHAQAKINGMKDLIEFTDKVEFPSHGIILKQIKDGKVLNMQKGIITWEFLYTAYLQLNKPGSSVIAETDMRGFMNPKRMKTIGRATKSLMKKITSLCPECQWPGFGVVETKGGLPCHLCGEPTKLMLVKTYQCKNCDHRVDRYHPEGSTASPQYCDHCNP